MQPSLEYVPDVQNTVDTVTTARHHLVFGRRGAGKTALLVEARKRLKTGGDLSMWMNLHTLRRESADRVFLHVTQRLCDVAQACELPSKLLAEVQSIYESSEKQLSALEPDATKVARSIPILHGMLGRFLRVAGNRLFIFLDDFHYLARENQPGLLDMIHGAVRDCDAWIKVAAIKHLTRWFDPASKIGLTPASNSIRATSELLKS
ncbi:MAG: ATP-binding protein [Planctomycetes bacterium]|nr:ATP-binding protein [Planctomycetota bacterium]